MARPTLLPAAEATPPNILLILCDDLGYGDVGCLNRNSKIATPNIDRLARQGMIFTDAHSSSAVCTPSRYGLLTGRYNWRSRLQSGVMGGMSPPLIEPGRLTLPAFLQRHGYRTAAVGKWHLGMDWTLQPGAEPFGDGIEKGEQGWRVDYSKPIRNGPLSVGFQEFFGIAASLDMIPYTYIEGDRAASLPSVDQAFPMSWGTTNRFTRRGPAAPDFKAEEVLPTLTHRAITWIRQQRTGHPFFLYLPLNSPHTPIAPSAAWRGRSGLNAYADFVMQTDACVGEILSALRRAGFERNTLVVFTSDNGCSPEAGFPELAARHHQPSHHFRGAKADIFEGGHRIPMVVKWPGYVAAGSRSSQTVCLNDWMATCADILQERLPENAGEDSVSMLPVLRGRATAPVRDSLIHHSINGSFAIRQGRWKLILCPDSGGWSDPVPGRLPPETSDRTQLYDLEADPGERHNLSESQPKLVEDLTRLLEISVNKGRTTPGTPQTNSVTVRLRKTTPSLRQ